MDNGRTTDMHPETRKALVQLCLEVHHGLPPEHQGEEPSEEIMTDVELGVVMQFLLKAAGAVCQYCGQDRRPIAANAGFWHRVARGGDLGSIEPCLAHGIYQKYRLDL
jgi:hypothetical protein